MDLYRLIRPIMTGGGILNQKSVKSNSIVNQAIGREKAKQSHSLIIRSFYKSVSELIEIATANKKDIFKVMDVGCACGDNISKIAKQMPELSFTAIDIIDEAIAIARKRFENLNNLVFRTNNFLTDDIGNIPDLILCLETLEHIEDNFLQVFIDRLLNLNPE